MENYGTNYPNPVIYNVFPRPSLPIDGCVWNLRANIRKVHNKKALAKRGWPTLHPQWPIMIQQTTLALRSFKSRAQLPGMDQVGETRYISIQQIRGLGVMCELSSSKEGTLGHIYTFRNTRYFDVLQTLDYMELNTGWNVLTARDLHMVLTGQHGGNLGLYQIMKSYISLARHCRYHG